MCGIVGLFAKTERLQPELGAHLAQMLAIMSDRGPDSAGFAVYSAPVPGAIKLTLRAPEGYDFEAMASRLGGALGAVPNITVRATHAVLAIPAGTLASAKSWLAEHAPEASIVGIGETMEIYKEVGLPAKVAERFGLAAMAGTHGIGHTRMATESAVTTKGAHPFSTGPDQCLVHNGSLSNHNGLRRTLMREGLSFETDNDSEVAAAYLTAQIKGGKSLGEALEASLEDLDGFFTFVVGTGTGFGVLRDPIACKPAVMAETEDYVAFGSEYRALAVLPGIESANVWEPEPAKVYFWEKAA